MFIPTPAASAASKRPRDAAQKSKADVAIPVDAEFPKEALVKGVLKCLQSDRLLRGMLLECIELPADNQYIKTATQATNNFMDLAKGYANNEAEKKNREIGQPHYHVWSAWMCLLEKDFKEDLHRLNVVVSYCKKYKEMGPEGMTQVMDQVKYAYKAKTNQAGRKRIEMYAVPSTESYEVMKLLMDQLRKQEGARVLPGRAPKGAQERELQRWLDEAQL
eukprot:TRINITY_DN27830_c0_g1_i1.p2 TRINITY_DN27830_c0_g1~~TRINITY_DN27830_c0_g1_i1.p2  ORF type:complete len:219 (-),score=53.83 TRINITY_DN27830_c0_g1_i1:244-900(-)